MSALWRDRIVIGLMPDRLSALRVSGNWRRRIVDQHDQALQPEGATSWEAATHAMKTLLATPAWSYSHVEVVLSNHWVHYAVVPGQRGFGSADYKTLAGIVFGKTYNDLCQEWDIQTGPAANGESVVASGVPRSLLDTLRTAAGHRLHSIRPALMLVFNRARRTGKTSGHIVLLENGRITVATLRDGKWQSIVSRAVVTDDPNALIRLLHNEITLQGQPLDGTLWLCDLGGDARMPSSSPWRTQTIEPPTLPIGAGGLVRHCLAKWGVQ